MRFAHREIDPVALWSNYVEFPAGFRPDGDDTFSGLVQCPNPEHDTSKKHFQINLKQPTVHCFAQCGISGHYEHAIALVEGLYEKFKVEEAGDDARERSRREYRARRQARKIILGKATGTGSYKPSGVRKKSSTDRRAATAISADVLHYEHFLPQVAMEYLRERGISSASVSAWELGWDADDLRLVIPAHDENGHLKFLIKRAVRPNDQPKYLYTEGFPKTAILFGVDKIDLGMIKSHGLGLVEGSIDNIVLHQHGLKFFGAILGTGISEQQRRIIARINPPRIILWFDKDSAGIKNIEIAARKLRKYPLYVARYPKGKSDPGEITKKEAWRQIERMIPVQNFMRRTGLNVNRRKEVTRFG